MVIPTGTGNDFYRSVGGILNEYDQKLQYCRGLIDRTIRYRQVDVGVVRYTNQKGV